MNASKENPVYTTYIVAESGKYDISPALISIDFADQDGQIAQRAIVGVENVLVNGVWLTSIIKVRQRIMIYADDGDKKEEVFRGYIWNRSYKSGLEDRELTLLCYDSLIYLQESEDYEYFSAGKSTKDILAAFCSKWGINLEYSYESITHEKLPLRGNLYNIFTADVLDLVKDRTGKRYVIRSEKDTMKIMSVGENPTVYRFIAGENAIQTRSECTMEGMITKVIILGKAGDDEREPVEATLTEKTNEYGTLQKVISRSESTTLADAKKEAQNILEEGSNPKWEYELKTANIPWIRKGDKVYVSAGDIYQRELIVLSIDRSISAKTNEMTLTMERA